MGPFYRSRRTRSTLVASIGAMQTRLATVALLLAFAVSACGSDAPAAAPQAKDKATATGSAQSRGGCTFSPDGTPAKPVSPPSGPPATGTVSLTMKTNQGDLHLSLDADATPCTVTSFVSLAKQGYFDGTQCHRLTTEGIKVLQCGDPTATGSGGPGYRFDDELTGGETYSAGTLAMANAGPDTNGSQFFFVYGDSRLSPAYTVFGSVDAASLKILRSIAQAGSDSSNGPGDGAPNTPVTIGSVS